MSKIGKKPIQIPEGVTALNKEGMIVVSGKGGTVSVRLLAALKVSIEGNMITVRPTTEGGEAAANWGTMAALLKNAIHGVSQGFSKALEIEGIGFRAVKEGENLVFNVGYTHPVKYTPRPGVAISVVKNVITVSGVNRETVGQVAAEIRKIRKPEPYKGKGIHYVGEVIRRKAGKKVAGTVETK